MNRIETIGDAFVGVTNLVKNQEDDHAKRIAEFAIDTLKTAATSPMTPPWVPFKSELAYTLDPLSHE
jgi:hypothetical protein